MPLQAIGDNQESLQGMKAVRVHQFGGLEVIQYEDIPRPAPGKGQVLIRVKAAGVGNWDRLVREGKSSLRQPLPLTLGSDLSGIVEAVGAGVADFRPGDAAFGVTNSLFTGAYAEYAVADAGMIAPKPPRLNDREAASVPVVAITAYQMLFDYGVVDSTKRVLVQGAAGNVGAYAVQLAKHAGAFVLATAFTKDVDYVRALGADQVIDVQTTRFEDEAHDIDAVIDTVGGETLTRSFAVLRSGGILVSSVSEPDLEEASRRRIRAAFFIVNVTSEGLNKIAALLETGVLQTHVGEVLPLSEARRAHEMLMGAPHKSGKIILTTNSDGLDFAAEGGPDILRQDYRSVIAALYPNVETAHVVAQGLTQGGIPQDDISIVVSEGKLRESLEKGVALLPPAEFRGVRQVGAVVGGLWGGAAGLALGAEIALLGASLTLPALGGVILLGVAFGATMDATFREMDLSAEEAGYRTHLHHGGAILAVCTRDDRIADGAEAELRKTMPSEIGRHPLRASLPGVENVEISGRLKNDAR